MSNQPSSIDFKIGLNSIESFRRLSYTAWHALAEFVDNSTQSYFNNRAKLDEDYAKKNEKLSVVITYEKDKGGLLRIADNAMGMSFEELQHALELSRPPAVTSGRSKYGMGMKTAACWLGDRWVVFTKKLGETVAHRVTIDVEKVAAGNGKLDYQRIENRSAAAHFTIIEIVDHHHVWQSKTISKIKDFLRSMYREDLTKGILHLQFRDEVLKWESLDSKLLSARDGSKYKKDFSFDVNSKKAYGWIGILDHGSRADAGFAILHCGRVIRGWPDSWRPGSLYGQLQGSNDLVNQRLVGEIHLDNFLVSHTKDDISWQLDEEEQVDAHLKEIGEEYRRRALEHRRRRDDERGPSESEVTLALNELKRELTSAEMLDQMRIETIPPVSAIHEAKNQIVEAIQQGEPTYQTELDGINVTIYLDPNMSPNDPYVTIESSSPDLLMIVVNRAHPHWIELANSQDALNYMRHCVYDGLAEWKARQKAATIDPDTIRQLKDGFLRIPMAIESHQETESARSPVAAPSVSP